jgi:transcriptional regulator with XRE-family HTH domain
MGNAWSSETARLGLAVRELRRSRNLTQQDFGKAAGIHRNYVGAMERGETNPTFAQLLKVTRALGVKLSDLIGDYESMPDPVPAGPRRRASASR